MQLNPTQTAALIAAVTPEAALRHNVAPAFQLWASTQDAWSFIGEYGEIPCAVDYATINFPTNPWALVSFPIGGGWQPLLDSAGTLIDDRGRAL